MRAGKISETVLKRSVLKHIKTRSSTLITGPSAGTRCGRCAVKWEGHMLSAQVSVTGSSSIIVETACHRLANDLSASGGELFGMMVTLFLPQDEEERTLKQIMRELSDFAQTYQADICGGHTEVKEDIREITLVLTGFGCVQPEVDVSRGLKPGQDLVMTKWAGAAGSACIVREERIRKKDSPLFSRFSGDFLERTEEHFWCMDSTREAKIAREAGAASLYNAGGTGLFGALWEMGESSGVGLSVELKKIPICQETIEICEFFDWNPYLIPSDGVLLAGAEDGRELVRAFEQEGILAAVIGSVSDDRGRVIVNGGEKRFLVPPGTDA